MGWGCELLLAARTRGNVPLTQQRQNALAIASAGAATGRAKIAFGDFFTPSTLKGRGEFAVIVPATKESIIGDDR